MANQSSNKISKETCQVSHQENYGNCDSNLVDQQSILIKFDKKGLELCGFISDIPLEIIKFFLNIFLKKGPNLNFTTDQLYSHVQKGENKLQKIIKNQKNIKDFLSKYPSLFKTDEDKISLCNPTGLIEGNIKWIKTLLQNDFPDINRTVLNAIQFYSDILYDKEDDFPIDKLVTHRNKAKQDVQMIALNPLELKSFLIAYPQIFIVKEEKVSLQYSAALDRNDDSWLEEICGMRTKTPRLRTLGKAVTYYLLILFKHEAVGQLTLPKLFAFRNLASKDIMELTKTVSDLRKFFVNYFYVFQVNKNNVMIKDSLLINLKRDRIRLRDKKGSDLSIKEVIFIILENLLKIALDVCLRTIRNTLQLKCLLEVPLKELLAEFEDLFENENDLRKFLSFHPKDFIIKDDMILLKCDDETNNANTQAKSKLPNLKKRVKSVENPAVIEQVKDFCVNFLLKNVGVNVQFPLTQFRNCVGLAPPELHPTLIDKNFSYMMSRYASVLNVTDNYILLKKGCEDQVISKAIGKEKLNESLMFFVWVLKEKVGVDTEFPIARLKIYVDIAPSDVMIEDVIQLKTFFKKHPNIFIVNNNNVILKTLVDENYSKYTRYDKLFYIESYSTTEAITFYARVLNRFCSNLEVPVEHLFGYRSLAPVEVIALAKSPAELKKFLSAHPDIFTVEENNVCLTKSEQSENSSEVYDDLEGLSIKFYSSILDRVSRNNEFPIVRLFGYQYLASLEVRNLIKTPLELKDFLNKYPKLFFVNNDVVLLKKSISKSIDIDLNDKLKQSGSFLKEVETTLCDLNLNCKPVPKTKSPPTIQNKKPTTNIVNTGFISRKSCIIRSIRFYSNIMFKKGPNSEHLISNLLCFRNEATNEIKEIAKKPTELLKFLSKFPQIFTVNSSKLTVMLTDMVSFYKNERSWIKELLPKYHQSTTNHEAVVSGIQFYVNIIFERGLDVLPIKSLFRYRKTAMGDVQTLANSSNELKDFLSMYPEIFKISDEGVSLTEIAVSHKIEPKWIEEIIGDNNFVNETTKTSANDNEPCKSNLSSNNASTGQNNDPALKDDSTSMTINFFKSVLESEEKGKNVTHSKLFEHLAVAPKEIKELFKTHSELKDFFIKHSTMFVVKDNFVSLVTSKSASKAKKRKKQSSVKNPDSSNSPGTFSVNTSTQNNPENTSQITNVATSGNLVTQVSKKKSSQCDIISAILFYSNIMSRKGPHLEHNIGNIFSHTSKASSNVKKIVKNTKELKEFLSKYPQLFSVNHEKQTVTFSDSQAFHRNQRSWIKEILPENHHETIVSTIQFYSSILFDRSPNSELPLPILFSYRNTAMEDVQMMVKNIKELNKFLSTYPNIFLINKDKVSLTDFAISQLKQPKWIEQLLSCPESARSTHPEGKENTDSINQELSKKKKIATRRAVQFFYKIMLTKVSNQGFLLSQLFDYLQEAPSDVQGVVKSVKELKDFFSKYPHIFTVADSVVFLTTFDK